jgi:hypothetical protein
MSRAEQAIRRALNPHDARTTDFFAREGRCTLGDATLILMRLEREGVAERGPHHMSGMTWRGPHRMSSMTWRGVSA